MIVSFIILAIAFAFLSGISKAVCDLSEEANFKGNPVYWHKDLSWKNKWKNGDKKQGEKFLGSSTIFVLFTDAWHLFGFLERLGFIVTYTMAGYLISINLAYLSMIGCYVLTVITFHIFYTKIFRK